jgi:hypothetical protein
MRKKSEWTRSEPGSGRSEGYATIYIDGNRIDFNLSRGRFSMDCESRSFVTSPNANNPAALADKLEEIAATFRDAAKQERERLTEEHL